MSNRQEVVNAILTIYGVAKTTKNPLLSNAWNIIAKEYPEVKEFNIDGWKYHTPQKGRRVMVLLSVVRNGKIQYAVRFCGSAETIQFHIEEREIDTNLLKVKIVPFTGPMICLTSQKPYNSEEMTDSGVIGNIKSVSDQINKIYGQLHGDDLVREIQTIIQ